MIGFIFGAVCLIGLVVLWRRGRGWPAHGCEGGFWPGSSPYGHRWRSPHRAGLYRALAALDTSPGQEKAIRGALGELRAALHSLRPQLAGARQSLAEALTSDPLDPGALERSLSAQLAATSSVSPALATAVAKIHDALDADQRRRLARLIDALPYGRAL